MVRDSKNGTEGHLIRILSYNIHHGEGMDGKVDLTRLARVIRSVSPDIVSLQEVDCRKSRTGMVDQIHELAHLTGMEGTFGCAIDSQQDGRYGNAVLSRFPTQRSKNFPLPGEPRAVLAVEVTLPLMEGRPSTVVFMATHLDTQSEPRQASISLLEESLAFFPGVPTLLAGDLNAVPQSPTLMALRRNWVNVTEDQKLVTIPQRDPKQIDYILFRPAGRWRVVDAQVIDERVASDHFPLFAILELLPPKLPV